VLKPLGCCLVQKDLVAELAIQAGCLTEEEMEEKRELLEQGFGSWTKKYVRICDW